MGAHAPNKHLSWIEELLPLTRGKNTRIIDDTATETRYGQAFTHDTSLWLHKTPP